MFASKLPIYLHLKTVQFFEKTCENKSFCFFTKKNRDFYVIITYMAKESVI